MWSEIQWKWSSVIRPLSYQLSTMWPATEQHRYIATVPSGGLPLSLQMVRTIYNLLQTINKNLRVPIPLSWQTMPDVPFKEYIDRTEIPAPARRNLVQLTLMRHFQRMGRAGNYCSRGQQHTPYSHTGEGSASKHINQTQSRHLFCKSDWCDVCVSFQITIAKESLCR